MSAPKANRQSEREALLRHFSSAQLLALVQMLRLSPEQLELIQTVAGQRLRRFGGYDDDALFRITSERLTVFGQSGATASAPPSGDPSQLAPNGDTPIPPSVPGSSAGSGVLDRLLPPQPATASCDDQTLPIIHQALKAFLRDLPQLLRQRQGHWVAYYGDKSLGFGTSKTALYQECLRQGYPHEEVLVRRIEPHVAEDFISAL